MRNSSAGAARATERAACAALAAVLVTVITRAWGAFARIAAALWTLVVTAFGILAFVVAAGVFSRGFQWVVASVPDRFWDTLI